MDKPAIKKFAIWARNKLKKDAEYCAEQIGITKEKIVPPLPQSTEETLFFDSPTGEPYKLVGKANIKKYRSLVESLKRESANKEYSAVYDSLIERAAYTWFNRMIAVRYMEVNDLLPSHTRVLSATDERKKEPQIVENPSEAILDYTPEEIKQIQDWQYNIGKNGVADMLFRMLFLKQCYALNEVLPKLFDNEDGYLELLLRINFTDADGVVYHLTHDIKEENWRADKTDNAVQIVGWLYQYYNTEPKEQVFANLKKNIKISKENIPAATQLFTPDWIVRYMVENSLGRLHVESVVNSQWSGASGQWSEENEKERIEKEKEIAEQMGWKYYLPEAEQSSVVRDQCSVISGQCSVDRDQCSVTSGQCSVDSDQTDHCPLTTDHSPLSTDHSPLTTLKCIDPCMGSGHILAYLFDVLMQIYRSAGYTDRDAAASIVEHNLYGLDIDDRAAQMAYFVVMMKGCRYDSRFLRRHLNPHVYAIQESGELTTDALGHLGKQESTARALLDGFKNAKEYGSILQPKVTLAELDALQEQLRKVDGASDMGSLTDQLVAGQIVNVLYPLIEQARMLVQKYDVVVTNPPYMGGSGMNAKLSDYVKKYYPDSKSDLFAVFIERCAQMDKPGGYQAMITQPSLLFLTSFEKLRERITSQQSICNLLHMGRGIFGIDFGSTSFVIRNSYAKGYRGEYFRLHERTFQYIEPTDIANLFLNAKNSHDYSYDFALYDTGVGIVEQPESTKKKKVYFETAQDNFSKIPGSPVAYWSSLNVFDAFKNGKSLEQIADCCTGMQTGNNDKYVRYWFEVSSCDFNSDAIALEKKWIRYNCGGESRKWYGNHWRVINWENNGYSVKHEKGSVIRNESHFFQEGISWKRIGSSDFFLRYLPEGFIIDQAGDSMFFPNRATLYYVLGFVNTKVALSMFKFIAPTLNLTAGNMNKLPIISKQEKAINIENSVKENIEREKEDWDSFETSWDFQHHPLLRKVSTIAEAFEKWQQECNDRFAKLKANEEELNRIFIDIYGLQDELTPEVEDKDVTVRRADLGRDIRSLISYAVGCIFGRYSLDKPGLAYAGGDWNPDQYHTFLPDADNVIPITDEEYFTDDLAGQFVAWVKKVFGADSLEENLAFIAKALGTKGTSPRAAIRSYFLNGFYADHVKIYQKRPIYWLYDSGKQNGFKALIYMHRYNADTSGLVRADYLYKMEQVYESEIARMDDAIAHGASREVAQATKRKEKLVKQLKECKDYDDRLGHIALARIPIDLDDGVKANYDKVQTGADGKKLAILAKI